MTGTRSGPMERTGREKRDPAAKRHCEKRMQTVPERIPERKVKRKKR